MTESTLNNSQQKTTYTLEKVKELYSLPFNDLIFKSHIIYRENFDVNDIEVAQLCSIKTGSCPEDCKYCVQSAHYKTGLAKEPLISVDKVIDEAKKAKENGVKRFCMGAAWRGPKDKDVEKVSEMIKAVKELGLETCATLGMVNEKQAIALKEAGLDYYNHNIDTSDDFYDKIITTRTFQDRIDTLEVARKAGMKVCCGGILGLGETVDDRLKMISILANMDPYPESVPINKLIPMPGTPLAKNMSVSAIEFIKIIAIARITMPKARVRLSAGRESMSEEMQALCFFAGANSVFYGEKLLTEYGKNPSEAQDKEMFDKIL
jgi:biotin synthase